VFSDHQLRSTLANATRRLRMSQIYDYLGSGARCGRCAHIIKRIMDEMTNGAIGPVDAASLHLAEATGVLEDISIGKSASELSQELRLPGNLVRYR